MYNKVLVTLDTSSTDRTIIEHIKALALELGSRVVLLHVADGWAARKFGADAVSPEVTQDLSYIEQVRKEMEDAGISTQAELAYGDPVLEIVKWVESKGCDLVAMGTHGHQGLADFFLGETASRVQHSVSVPVLMLRAVRDNSK